MRQVVKRSGVVGVEEIPAPTVEPGTVRVRVEASCISAGTEGASLGSGTVGLLAKAAAKPALVRKVMDMARERGIAETWATVRARLRDAFPTGYSLAGVVEEVGEGVAGFEPGDRVACAGAGVASHAEIAVVPVNLVVPVPAAVDLREASSVALGAIALQGVRRLEPTLGEWVGVVGLGLLGQLTVQILRANGCRVIGTDLDPDRVALARSRGMEAAIGPEIPDALETVRRITGGHGADGVIITAATPSDDVVSEAFRMCRRKGRVVLVGDVGLGLRREDLYEKELDFRISTSYGPGRYDDRYEEKGLDYPLGYVRWTEGRNMEEYLRLLAEEKVTLEGLIHATFPVDEAADAFAALDERAAAPFVFLRYPRVDGRRSGASRLEIATRAVAGDRIGVAVVGAGSFARSVHLPNLRRLDDRFHLRAVVSRTGLNAKEAADEFDGAWAGTDLDEALRDPGVDAVVVCTRHHLHASMTLSALEAGKHVLVEKPLALDDGELSGIEAFYRAREETGEEAPVLLPGLNRRFSPAAAAVRSFLDGRTNPALLVYRMNAGHIPRDHWVHGDEGGGRNIGEACHVYDLFIHLLGSQVRDVTATSIRPETGHYGRNDNFTATLRFDDGSLATLHYTALGSREMAKERLEAFCDGGAALLDDYRSVEIAGSTADGWSGRKQEKGHRAELEAFAAAVRGEAPWPIPLDEQLAATRVSFRVEELIAGEWEGEPPPPTPAGPTGSEDVEDLLAGLEEE